MPNQHKHSPVSFRPPETDRRWLLEYAALTGQPVNAVLVLALAAYRDQHRIPEDPYGRQRWLADEEYRQSRASGEGKS